MTKFTEFPLSAALQQKLAAANFVSPTPVQEATIPGALEGKDILATAQTGTGKTLAFLVPVLQSLGSSSAQGIQALVLVPTRELAMQVHEQFEQLRASKLKPAALVVGGLAERKQIQAIRRGACVVVATPGRLEDYLRRKLIDLRGVKHLVLDEADRMLDLGFMPAIKRILGALPSDRQTLCFSATMENSVKALVEQCMRNPVRVSLGATLKPAETVDLQAFEVTGMQKNDALRQLLYNEKGKTLVFARTKRGTERLAKELAREGFSTAMIHGDRTQSQRNSALSRFEQGEVQVLVATDVAARGLHVDDIAHVINFELPSVPEDFVHRVGRTGRAGASGIASTLVSGAEIIELRRFERALKLRIKRRDFKPQNSQRTARASHPMPGRTLRPLPGEVFA